MQTQLLSTAGGTQPCAAQASWHPGAGFCPGREHLLLGWVPERSWGPLPSRPPSSTHPTPPGSGTQQQHLGHARPSPEGPRSDQRSCRGRSAGSVRCFSGTFAALGLAPHSSPAQVTTEHELSALYTSFQLQKYTNVDLS